MTCGVTSCDWHRSDTGTLPDALLQLLVISLLASLAFS